MKIMIIAPYYYPYIGGLENYARHIAEGLAGRGHQIIIVTSNQKHGHKKVDKINGITVYRLPYILKIFNTPVNPLWRRQLRQLIREVKPDVINAHTPVPYIADLSERVRGEIPYVLTYHNDLTKNGFIPNTVCRLEYLALTNKTLKRSTSIIGTSQAYIDRSPYLLPFLDKCSVVAPGVDTALFARPEKRPSHRSIVFVGQLHSNHSHKGLNVLIDAMSLLTYDDVDLIVVGEGNAITSYQEQANRIGFTAITFMGRVSDKKLSTIYKNASLLVLPSTSNAEGFGMVILEAAASGVPAVASNIGGIGEAIQNGKTGLLVEPNNAHALAEAISTMLADNTLRNQMGDQAYTRAVSEFNWGEQARKTEAVLQKTIREHT